MPVPQGPNQEQEETGFRSPCRHCEGHSQKTFFPLFLRSSRLLREVQSQQKFTVATILFERVPAGSGTCLGAGTALEGDPSRISRSGEILKTKVTVAAIHAEANPTSKIVPTY